MSKKLILVIAFSLVLASGGLFSAQADCGLNPCGWHFPSLCNINWNPCNWFTCGAAARDKDLPDYNPYPQRVHAITFGCCGAGETK